MLPLFALYLLIGICAGTLAGLFGIGGGLVIVPLLIFTLTLSDPGLLTDLSVHIAVGSSLATICLTSSASAWQHWRQKTVDWADISWLAPGLAGGAALGGWVADRLSGEALSVAVGVFALLTAFQMSLNLEPKARNQLSGKQLLPAGVLIGGISTLFGIGGGSLTVPFLRWAGRAMLKAVGTSAVCALPVAGTGAIAFALTGMDAPVPPWSTGYIFWPAVLAIGLTGMPAARLGAILAGKLNEVVLQRAFAIFLLLVGLSLIARSADLLP